MATAFRLQTVLELAARRLDVATAELQKLRVREQQAQTRLDQLQDYRTEYEANLAAQLLQGLPADRLRDFQAATATRRRVAGAGARAARSRASPGLQPRGLSASRP